MIRYFTAGESHGRVLTAVVEGVPAGVSLMPEMINYHLMRRQQGYGRGNRMKIETDRVDILNGVRFGKTIGAPISLLIENKDWKNWTDKMNQFEDKSNDIQRIDVPRPGHADYSGRLKYGFDDIRPVIERSSARETAARVAACTIARQFLKEVGVEIGSYLSAIGSAIESEAKQSTEEKQNFLKQGAEALMKAADLSPVRMLDKQTEERAIELIDDAKKRGDTLGGVIEVFISGLPVGLGSYAQHDRKLDAQLAAAIISIQAVKGVEFGSAFRNAISFGSMVHDEVFLDESGFPHRKTNRAGGIEGGMTNGETVHLRVAMKPISTLMNPLHSVNLTSMEESLSHIERSDACAAPACGVIAEAVVAPVIANAILDKFGGDNINEVKERLVHYREQQRLQFLSKRHS